RRYIPDVWSKRWELRRATLTFAYRPGLAMTQTPPPDDPPTIAPWLLHIRFGLEVGALIALGAGARHLVGHGPPGWVAWVAAVAVPLGVAALWGTFAVPRDPSRSGKAPVPVSGALRIALEMAVFFGAAASLASLHWWDWFDAFMAGFVVHHIGTRERILWVLRQSPARPGVPGPR
ncbi:MAG TPA: YrdB family protein, partial [Polyangiaceae bacterium]|nr:YrdB family protein [Polyangiaceae bacterium]